jgi:adenylyl-sulfate kinase
VRHGLSRDLGFSPGDRKENIRRVAEVARLFNDAGLFVITAFISPYREDRDAAREIIGPAHFLEAYLCTPITECERRDPKGLYRRARAGSLPEFTGVSAPYEPPQSPAIALDTAQLALEECLERLIAVLRPLIIEAR